VEIQQPLRHPGREGKILHLIKRLPLCGGKRGEKGKGKKLEGKEKRRRIGYLYAFSLL